MRFESGSARLDGATAKWRQYDVFRTRGFDFVGREVLDEMKDKVGRFAAPKGFSVRTALVYDGELAPSVEADGYFDAIVPFSRLLGL